VSPLPRLPLLLLLAFACSCAPATPPPTRETVTLRGDAYTRGLQHGQQLKAKIHGFYTTLLTSSLYPYLNREQPEIALALPAYAGPDYADGKFSHALLRDSAKRLERGIPRVLRDELRGISDGSGLAYDDVLILNTFADTVLAVRAVTAAIRQAKAPSLTALELLGVEADGADNDGDGEVDEPGEGGFSPLQPSAVALARELPAGVRFRLTFVAPDGVDPATVRLRLGETVYEAGHPGLQFEEVDATTLRVTLTPEAPLAGAAVVGLQVNVGDRAVLEAPPPVHARFMRDERMTFTTAGAGKPLGEVPNAAADDGRSQPPALSFALRGTATAEGHPLLAQNFALLDANTAHKHTATFIHHPDSGPSFAVVGWAGVAWGFSGMNAAGLSVACQYADTLDNSVVAGVFDQVADLSKATLTASGTPMGIAVRKALSAQVDVAGAEAQLSEETLAYGWNCLLADPSGAVRGLELDADLSKDGGAFGYGPGEAGASVGPDDLRMGVHYQRNTEDIFTLAVAGQRIQPQRFWSTTWYRSLRAIGVLGDALRAGYGRWDAAGVQGLLSTRGLEDVRDGMNAVVLDPVHRALHVAQGAVPATSAGFQTVTLEPSP
jgi:hypothetical protein